MIEQLSVVQQAIESVGLSESASIITDALKMTEGAIIGQLTLVLLKLSMRFLTPAKLEPVEKAILDVLSNGSWDETKETLVKDKVSAGFNNGVLTVIVEGNAKAGDLLSPSAKSQIRSLIARKQSEFKNLMLEIKTEEAQAEKRLICEKLSKKQ